MGAPFQALQHAAEVPEVSPPALKHFQVAAGHTGHPEPAALPFWRGQSTAGHPAVKDPAQLRCFLHSLAENVELKCGHFQNPAVEASKRPPT